MNLSQAFKANQKRNGIILSVGIGFLVVLFLLLTQESEPVKKEIKEEVTLHDVTTEVEDKSLWLFKSENRLEEQRKQQEALLKEVEELKSELREIKEAKNTIEPSGFLVSKEDSLPSQDNSDYSAVEPDAPNHTPQASGIFSVELNAYSADKKSPHIDSYIPAGSYASAILLNGVDVSAGVSSQASPQPVLIKLIHRGSLPNKTFGKMKECRVVAAAYGDLSSERAYMRLEKLSCVKPDGHVVESKVDGYVSGNDGKNGVRGRVVIRDAEMLKRGFMGGVLSGLGKATSNSFNSTSVSPFGSVNSSTAKGVDIFKQAGAQGSADAFELMARYNIQRAEQYQPVIQIGAATKVEVVFLSGAEFGEQKVMERKEVNNHE